MSDLVFAALERLPRRVRRFVVAIGALLALSAVMAALTLTTPHGGQGRRPVPQHPAATVPRTPRRRLPLPVSTAALLQARRVADRFLAGYLPLAYGRGSASAVSGVTLALRRQLLRQGLSSRRPSVAAAHGWCRCRRSARRRRSSSRRRRSTTAA